MKNFYRIFFCIIFANITLSSAPQDSLMNDVYDCLVLYNKAQIAFAAKTTIFTKTDMLLAKSRLLNAALLHYNNPDVSAEKKELCVAIIRSFLAVAAIKSLHKIDVKASLEQQALHHK